MIVRVYQLKGKEPFETADFIALWKEDEKVLEGALLDRREVTLLPNQKTDVSVATQKEAAYLGLMALFRTPDGNHWREIVPLQKKKVHSVEIYVGAQAIKAIRVK